jgi:hypothetical protein
MLLFREQIKALIARKYGIAKEHDSGDGPFPKPRLNEERPPYQGVDYPPWPPLGEGLDIFSHTVKNQELPKEYELTSRHYNHVESLDGYSELRIRITDGQELLGKKVTILQVRRRDHSKERARLNHAWPIPLPYKEYLAFTVVTDTEVKIIESLKLSASEIVAQYLVLTKLIWEPSQLEDLLAEMRKMASNSER